MTGAGRWVSPVLSADVAWHGAACIPIRAESLAASAADRTPRTPLLWPRSLRNRLLKLSRVLGSAAQPPTCQNAFLHHWEHGLSTPLRVPLWDDVTPICPGSPGKEHSAWHQRPRMRGTHIQESCARHSGSLCLCFPHPSPQYASPCLQCLWESGRRVRVQSSVGSVEAPLNFLLQCL